MEKRITFKFFNLAEFLEEQQFLEEQHRNGWKLKDYKMFTGYCFEDTEPEEYVYRLDYQNDDNINEGEYLQMFKDCGWEFVLKFNTWYYFRKPKSMSNLNDNEIFTDAYSKISMIKRIQKTIGLVAITGGLIPLYFLIFVIPRFNNSYVEIGSIFIWIAYAVEVFLLTFIYTRMGLKLRKLKAKLN